MIHPDQILDPDARADVSWRISSYSGGAGSDCVEAGALPDRTGRISVRHSHHPDGVALVVGRSTWAMFVNGVKNHELGPLIPPPHQQRPTSRQATGLHPDSRPPLPNLGT